LVHLTVPEVGRLVFRLVVLRLAEEQVLHWSSWRRRHQMRAKHCHRRKRRAASGG
jgi:hypothetical protein